MKNRLKLLPLLTAPLLILSLLLAFPVYADQTFHTTRLPLILTTDGTAAGHPALQSGHVVDIHANGPKIYALERYMINGAKPNTDYQVQLSVSLTGCNGPQNVLVPTALLVTNAQGNAYGNFTFTPAAVASSGLHADMTLGITWMLLSGGIAAYQTPSCINVPLD
jgi:hypothetical protein